MRKLRLGVNRPPRPPRDRINPFQAGGASPPPPLVFPIIQLDPIRYVEESEYT